MESIAVKPRRAQIMTNVIALGILCGLSLTGPVLGAVCAMLLPLFACPLAKHKEEKLAWASCAAPAVGCLLRAGDPALAAALLVPGMLPLLLTRQLHPKERSGVKGIVLYTSLVTLCMALVLGVLSWRATAPLPDMAMEWVARSKAPGAFLIRLAQAGLISVPEGYQPSGLMTQLLQPVLINEMLLSFRRTVELFVHTQLPMLLTQACMLVGLFTALRVEHLNGVMLIVEIDPNRPGERKTHVTSPPGFRLLAMPPKFRLALVGLLVLCAVLMSSDGTGHTLALMGAQFILTSYQLVGASVMVFVFARNNPDQIIPIGVVTGLVFAMLPTIPFLIGLSDSFIHYRTHKVREDSES